ncbi:Alkanal monooxygenase alpha chain [Falsiruegeria litorea R37]|uniref:Alkanal monooxygenase alpha chain n=1 Tax=Falsiruegeria litorea R37 TaxID=1200284 RepID=A0A1Y5SBQ3_9RHOB|nr:LLM class oxidoreductase [Falsiruegeria litorea]SLN35531.1 Alkanal monooxygenase alpha chain [Falsiruegeria litorea R37]
MTDLRTLSETGTLSFPTLNRAYDTVFQPGELSLGLVVPLDAHHNDPVPDMSRHLERAQMADQLGFSALWLRDVPFNVPSFGDAGQVFDPFVYLGLLSGATRNIALGVASIILPLRHPADVAKAAASADQLSGGRLLLGVASGDRPEEYPALGMSYADRGARFRESLAYIRAVAADYPTYSGDHGTLNGALDMLPKPTGTRLPILITGGSQQSPDWVAAHGDGWMTYPRDIASQAQIVRDYRAREATAGAQAKPVMQSLYVDLVADDDAPAQPIHLGFRSGVSFLKSYLGQLRLHGINHVALNLRFNQADIEDTMRRLAAEVLPEFPSQG